jgi:formylmethanofuran dehydrogenase subunit E
MRYVESQVIVFDEYAEGLFKTELCDYLLILFHFDRVEEFQLKTYTRSGNYKGVFATCSPRRPSKIGSTIVKFIERNENILRVHGLEAQNGTPVIDIKPLHLAFSGKEMEKK